MRTGYGITSKIAPTSGAGTMGPQGPIGPTGGAGSSGPTGAAGPKGDKGDTGATGGIGAIGATGQNGLPGIKGDAGAQGPIGLTGPTGFTGPQGNTGAQGIKGDTGNTGPQGIQGQAGLDAKRIDTYNGTTDANGLFTVTYATAFPTIPSVQPEPLLSANQTWVKVTSTTNGFSMRLVQRAAVTLLATEVLLAAVTNVVGASVKATVIAS